MSPYSSTGTGSSVSPTAHHTASQSSTTKPGSSHWSHHGESTPGLSTPYSEVGSEYAASTTSTASPPPTAGNSENPFEEEHVVARVSFHVLREERGFQIAKNLIATVDPKAEHIVKPIDLMRLAPLPGDRGTIVVAIYKDSGLDRIPDLLDLGPAFYRTRRVGDKWETHRKADFRLQPPISLQDFLDFAIGASQCLEVIHHGQGVVHGEIRGDAFHFNSETGVVKFATFGSGLRSFEHGLTSTGWSTLSKELGAKNKLLFISPEQTGRMPAEPDTRTDIYSLGVLFWTLLARQPVFEGEAPLDIVQGVLGRRIPNVSGIRMDVPDVIGRIIQKCTSKNVTERYHSASGLRYDLAKVQEFLSDGDQLALKEWQIGSRDVSAFFMLPTIMIGRSKERAELLKIIEGLAKSHSVSQRGSASRFSDAASSLSNEILDVAEGSSEGGASSTEGAHRGSGSFTATVSSDLRSRSGFTPSAAFAPDSATISGETVSSGNSITPSAARLRPWERQQSLSMETRSVADSLGMETARHSMTVESTTSLSKHLGSVKFRRRGHCEIVAIEGAGGLGKSCLVQSVLPEARRRGYCATAKFDNARRTAYGPLLNLLSSLFRQVWGERNTGTPFHLTLQQYVRPVWPMLHKVLGLPEFLLGAIDPTITRSPSTAQDSGHAKSLRAALKRRSSSPDSSPASSTNRTADPSAHGSQDFLRSGASTKSIRLMSTFLDVLRMFTHHKFICFCLDDLHFADDESLELISQIVGAKMRLVIIITYRPEEFTPEKVQRLMSPPESKDYPQSGGPRITKITLAPLGEEDIIQYVSATLCRPKEEVLPLALGIQSKTAGNPFYMREMLNACYRQKCIWYDYKDSQWHYDLDKLFDQFQSDHNYDILDSAFITRRLNELPSASRSILAWAALVGQTFSFDFVCKLMNKEFHDVDDGEHQHKPFSQRVVVAGLQAAIQAYIIVPSAKDDRFRFAHDRYIQAAAALKETNAKKMHFVIAQTLLKYYSNDPSSKDSTASHICESVDLIRTKVSHRLPYRSLLLDCAQDATESGARPTAAKYYSNALALLQSDPWDDDAEDVSYNESVQLYLRAAECYLYMARHSEASALLQIILASARTVLDKAAAWVLQSRIYAQSGHSRQALDTLKQCLRALDIPVDDEPTYEKCDAEFERLFAKVRTMDHKSLINPTQSEPEELDALGAILAETAGASWWSDRLNYYSLALLMLSTHLERGAFPQSGMAFLHVAMISLSRFNRIQFAIDLSAVCLELLEKYRDPFSMARGYMIFANFVSHVQYPVGVALGQLEGTVEFAAGAGDRISTILSYGLCAQLRFFASENSADLETFCRYGCEEIQNWHLDTRGGTILIAVRQTCRALQGKTRTDIPLEVLSDDHHNAVTYKNWLKSNTDNGDRSQLFYETMELVPLFVYGHYQQVIEMGKFCYENADLIWSARNTRLAMLMYGLSLSLVELDRRLHCERPWTSDSHFEAEEIVRKVTDISQNIKAWEAFSDVNYLAWSKLVDAHISEMLGDHGGAIRDYEEAIDHASEFKFVFEEALGNYLMATFFIRRKASRSARSSLRDAVSLYRQLGATGVADYIETEHGMLLHGSNRYRRTADVGVQTDFAGDAASVQFPNVDHDDGENTVEETQAGIAELKGERVGAWRGSMQPEAGAGLPALDMIDLHAILVSSQVISSVLRVDELLKTMCDVILQTCGGSATFAAIVVQEDGSDWCVAASGDPERGAEAHMPGIPLSGTHLVAENVILYCTRFREVVFLRDLISDERFGNVSEQWLQRNPLSKAVIAIPICHGSKPLLGVLYLEGLPGSFTDRNVTVLQLLVNQIGISYSNAMAMKAVEKFSAENVGMVALQKRALAKAIEAETKAKDAESEAKRNVKLAEEAAKAKSIFLANVSHELRTPLNGVIGNSELLRDSNLNKEQQEMADSIRVSADLLLTVINDILDFSRMEAAKMKLYVIAFNPEEMVREVVRAVSYSNREKASKKNVKIVQDINLPPMLIYGDPIRLHQVLGNLIGNSLKFTEDGSISIGARVESETEERATLAFWVEDTGIGIPSQQMAKLFQPFSQADTSTARKYGGSGLGLSICKSLIETMMKGKIQLESKERQGTKAWFTVVFDKARPEVVAGDAQTTPPRLQESRSQSAPAATELVAANYYTSLNQVPKDKLRICIAEDNAINAKIAMQYMQRLGYNRIDAYDNGLKAVNGLRAKAKEGLPYHIILMDVQMPVLDGYEATKLIRTDENEAVRSILVIAMTASAIQGDREKCLAAGMNDYLAKPVRSDVLKKKLESYLGGPQVRGRPPAQITLDRFS